jgi:hypothetical protein
MYLIPKDKEKWICMTCVDSHPYMGKDSSFKSAVWDITLEQAQTGTFGLYHVNKEWY